LVADAAGAVLGTSHQSRAVVQHLLRRVRGISMPKEQNMETVAAAHDGECLVGPELSAIYAKRFRDMGIERRDRIWKVLCRSFFDRRMVGEGSVLDLACGYGEFINNIRVRTKYAIDLNPDTAMHTSPDVSFTCVPADHLSHIDTATLDRVFTSNFLEHLPDKATCDRVLREVLRVLRPGGEFLVLGPNIRYLYDKYWDFYDHYLPLSHLSLSEGLAANGYEVVEVIDRFLPYTMQSNAPQADFLIKTYLRMPLAWKVFGKQFLVTARKPRNVVSDEFC
jgi:SAM-dependent methyltransferase